ncbi:sialate O-acetylesterase [Sphingomonas sp. SFZ2018-12]|nr:sialate O-acetylesterase [Sphingomonas sp. SFZ2018-12]
MGFYSFLPPLLLGTATLSTSSAGLPDVYLLMGQSNMSGRGDLNQLTMHEREPDSRITVYANDGHVRPAREPLDDASDQIDRVSADPNAAVGPGLFFARHLLAARRVPIRLVPCAKGGTSIREWRPDPARSTLFGSCMARARESGGRIAGILWYQGESDTRSTADVTRWSADFSRIVSAARTSLGQPNLPVILVRIARQPKMPDLAARYPAWNALRSVQLRLEARCVERVGADNIPLNPDGLHLSTPAQRTLGLRIAATMARLQRQCRNKSGS